MKNKTWLYRIGALVILLAICVVMFIIGRGHTIYLDNKTIEYNGEEITALHKITVNVNGERIAKLSKKDRGMATCMGQKFEMELVVVKEKGDDEVTIPVTLTLPYNMDGIVINLPAYLAGLPEEAYLSEFVSIATTEEEEEEVVTDEFGVESFDVEGDL